MSEFVEPDCKDLSWHWLHICQLKKQGKQKEMDELMAEPRHTCQNCNAVAKYAKNLCNPVSLGKG